MNIHRYNWNAPKRQVDITPTRKGPWFDTLRSFCRILGTGFTSGIAGNRGAGKTQMGVELMKLVTGRDNKPAYYMTAAEFIMRIKKTWGKDAEENEFDIIQELRKPSLLVVDEIGKLGDNPWEKAVFYELYNKRYSDVKDTFLISNLASDEMEIVLGDSIVSRINETGGIINCDWDSFRK